MKEKIAQVTTAGRMAQFAQGLGFDLSDTLSSDVKILADLFEGVVFTVYQPKTQFQYLALAV